MTVRPDKHLTHDPGGPKPLAYINIAFINIQFSTTRVLNKRCQLNNADL